MAALSSKSKKSSKKATSKGKRVSVVLDLDELENLYRRQLGRDGDGDTKGLLRRALADGDTKGGLSRRLSRTDGDTKGDISARRLRSDGDTKGSSSARRLRSDGDTKGSSVRRRR